MAGSDPPETVPFTLTKRTLEAVRIIVSVTERFADGLVARVATELRLNDTERGTLSDLLYGASEEDVAAARDLGDLDPLPEQITTGDKYEPAMKITDRLEARRYFERCVEHSMRTAMLARDGAEATERRNLGYFAGYYGVDTQKRVEDLYGAIHPYFGRVGGADEPKTPQDFLDLGQRLAEAHKKGVSS